MKQVFKNIILFMIFGAIYFALECLWKGRITHWSMFILAGIVGVIIGNINESIFKEIPMWQQCLAGMAIATLGEGITGLIVNVWLGLNVWHYTVLPFFWGQCSIPFCIIWLGLSYLCVITDDFLRWKLFGEEKPHYKQEGCLWREKREEKGSQ